MENHTRCKLVHICASFPTARAATRFGIESVEMHTKRSKYLSLKSSSKTKQCSNAELKQTNTFDSSENCCIVLLHQPHMILQVGNLGKNVVT